MKEYLLSVTEASHELAEEYGLSVTPHTLSNLIYRRVLAAGEVRLIGGRRMISVDYMPALAALLRERAVAHSAEPLTE
jgi:hypothetical protein